jgi:hypothetical protein
MHNEFKTLLGAKKGKGKNIPVCISILFNFVQQLSWVVPTHFRDNKTFRYDINPSTTIMDKIHNIWMNQKCLNTLSHRVPQQY